MPPPSCTGGESPSACRIARITDSFLGFPAAAPFRSTRCRRRAPSDFQCFAMPTGSSENTVVSLIFPCLRRTQCPSLMSSAGMISIESEKRAGLRTPGTANEDSGIPVEEVGEEPKAGGMAFFRMELYRENIILCQRAGKGDAVLGGALHQRRLPCLWKVAVDEIEAAIVFDAGPQGVRAFLPHLIPSHVRHLEPTPRRIPHRRRGKPAHLPPQQGEPCYVAFLARFEQHLQADADP